MSIISQTLNALKHTAALRATATQEPVRIWQLIDDEDDLPRIQRELAKQSLQVRALR